MRHLLLNTIIFVLLALLGMLVLLITLTSTIQFKTAEIEPVDDFTEIRMYADTSIDSLKLDVDYINFKIYTLQKIEKNNEDILQIKKEIIYAKRSIEEERIQKINNLNKQNTQLKAGLKTYQKKTINWQSFRTNFNRMGLSLTELFDSKKII